MRRFRAFFLVVFCATAPALATGSAPVLAAASPAAAGDAAWPGGPAWNGVWVSRTSLLHKYNAVPVYGPPPKQTGKRELKGVYARKAEELHKAAQAGHPREVAGSDCRPTGMPQVMDAVFLLETMATPGKLVMISEWLGEVRRIYTDGRPHPADYDPSYEGHSIGHWEGNTLVVDTVGINPARIGSPFSDALHVVEHIRLIGPNTLEDRMTIQDPKALVHPYEIVHLYDRAPKGMEAHEYVCSNNRDEAQSQPLEQK